MIFRQFFDNESSTYTYLVASRAGAEALIMYIYYYLVKSYSNFIFFNDMYIRGSPREGPGSRHPAKKKRLSRHPAKKNGLSRHPANPLGGHDKVKSFKILCNDYAII